MYSSTQNVFLQIAKYAFSEKHLHSTPLCLNLSVEHFGAQCRPCVEPCLCAIFFCAQIVVELVQCRIWTECRTLQSGAPLPASCFLSAQTEVNVCLLPQSLSHWWSSWFNHRKLQTTAIKTTGRGTLAQQGSLHFIWLAKLENVYGRFTIWSNLHLLRQFDIVENLCELVIFAKFNFFTELRIFSFGFSLSILLT